MCRLVHLFKVPEREIQAWFAALVVVVYATAITAVTWGPAADTTIQQQGTQGINPISYTLNPISYILYPKPYILYP